jgi:hypothetical protein
VAWQHAWLAGAGQRSRELWRAVEAQHRVATIKLADSLQEQELLEQILEASKPRLPPEGAGMDYLLASPFRYTSPWPSRFRRALDPGAWYGADDPATTAAEVAHWRWKFFVDSDGLRDEQVVTEHTFFLARFDGSELDITVAPWTADRDRWRDPGDYTACQDLTAAARAFVPPVQAIRYESARREGGMCQVVFDVRSLARPQPHMQQTWTCKTTRARVLLSHDADRLQFDLA